MRGWRSCIFILALLCGAAFGPQPAGATTPDEYFVARVHQDFLLRSPTDAELAAGVAAVQATTRGTFVRDLLRSVEFKTLWIEGVYLDYLERGPTTTEVSNGLTAIGTGHDYLAVEVDVLEGAEYDALAGGTNGGFVDRLYTDLLRRTPSTGDRAYWVDRLDTGTTRTWMATFFLRTTETADLRVGGVPGVLDCPALSISDPDALAAGSYCLVLDRVAESGGRTYWTAQLTGSAQLPDLWRNLAASIEYHTLAQPVP